MFNLFPARRFFRVNPTVVRLRYALAPAIVLPLFLFGIREPLSHARTLQVRERPIVYGAPIEQALEGRQVDTYQIDLNEGQYVRIVVEQRGVDVVVALRSPDGAQIYEVDSPNGTAGTEEIPYVVKRSGRYAVTVASFDEKAPAGSPRDQPDARQRQHEDRNGQRLRQVERAAAHPVSSRHHEVAGDVGGEDMAQGKEAGQVDHSGDDTEQRRQPRLQLRQLQRVIRRIGNIFECRGPSSER